MPRDFDAAPCPFVVVALLLIPALLLHLLVRKARRR